MDFREYIMPEDSYPKRPKMPNRPMGRFELVSAEKWKIFAAEMEKHEDAVRVYRAELDAYNKAYGALIEKFWKDAFEELGIPENHPKAAILRSKADEHGHSDGISNIFYWLQEFWEVADAR